MTSHYVMSNMNALNEKASKWKRTASERRPFTLYGKLVNKTYSHQLCLNLMVFEGSIYKKTQRIGIDMILSNYLLSFPQLPQPPNTGLFPLSKVHMALNSSGVCGNWGAQQAFHSAHISLFFLWSSIIRLYVL